MRCLLNTKDNEFSSLKNLLSKEEKDKKALEIINRVKSGISKVHDRSIEELNNEATQNKMKEISTFSPKVEFDISIKEESKGFPIPAEIEAILFGYYYAGVGLKTIYDKYGTKYSFTYSDLVSCSKINKWSNQINAIKGEIVNKRIDTFSQRSEEYCNFLDDIISEGMARFLDNVKSNKVSNPFETLKITSIKDLKEAMQMWLELQNKGVKKVEITSKSLSDIQASKMLEILNSEITEGEIIKEIEDGDNVDS
jgi:hypothetical protein